MIQPATPLAASWPLPHLDLIPGKVKHAESRPLNSGFPCRICVGIASACANEKIPTRLREPGLFYELLQLDLNQ